MMDEVVAVVLAAGESRRMGAPKMVLPWGQRTVIGQVVSVIQEAGLGTIIVVTGGAQTAVRDALQGEAVQVVPNERYATGEMLSSNSNRAGGSHVWDSTGGIDRVGRPAANSS